MQIDDLSTLASLTLAGSLAMERFVVIAKTAVPWLAEAKVAAPGESEMRADKARRRVVLGLTIVASLITAAFIGEGETWFRSSIAIGSTSRIPWFVFALMISGGSAFWTSIVGFASATKDVRAQEKLDAIAASRAARVVPTV